MMRQKRIFNPPLSDEEQGGWKVRHAMHLPRLSHKNLSNSHLSHLQYYKVLACLNGKHGHFWFSQGLALVAMMSSRHLQWRLLRGVIFRMCRSRRSWKKNKDAVRVSLVPSACGTKTSEEKAWHRALMHVLQHFVSVAFQQTFSSPDAPDYI